MQKKIFKFLVKSAVTAGFLFWIIFKVDWREAWFYLEKVEVWQIAVYITFLILGMLICSEKWKMLANSKGIRLSSWNAFKFYFTGTFINNFMPSFIGGDTYKAYQIGKKEKKYSEAFSTVVMDRVTGLLGAMILTLFFALLNFKIISNEYALMAVNLVILLALAIFLVVLKFRKILFRSRFFKWVPEKAKSFVGELDGYNDNSGIILKSMLYSFFFGLVGLGMVNYVIFLALGIEIGFLSFLSVIFLISIISSVPVSINNIGIKEWAYITFFGLFGVSAAAAVTAAILSRFIQMFISFLALPVYLKNKE